VYTHTHTHTHTQTHKHKRINTADMILRNSEKTAGLNVCVM